ncbi:hypothetical protein [Algiphilus sp.]|uniref:hypothetical protein n=1 Tax=Algiphilus sp. TaxID=1872431 RepID=UPI0032ED65EE
MKAHEHDLLKIQEIRDQLDSVKGKAQEYRAKHAKERYFGALDQGDDPLMRSFYEKNYLILLDLTEQYEHQIALLEDLNNRKSKLEYENGRSYGFNFGLLMGALVGAAILAPLLRFL